MKYYECDFCGGTTFGEIIRLNGYTGISGGILLPG